MRELGMKPVFQGFAGFVPKAMKEHYPEINLTTTRWNGFNSYMLSPLDSLFTEIAKRYIETWEAEFGKGTYYLIDSVSTCFRAIRRSSTMRFGAPIPTPCG